VPKAGRKWEPQGLPRSEARIQTTLHPWRRAHTAISSAETTLIAGGLGYNPDPVEPPADGSALICCSQPRDDVVLDL
jgi:hypothetical protein